MHFLKKGQKIQAWVDPPPSFGQCPKENVFFPIDVIPYGIRIIRKRYVNPGSIRLELIELK